jgi:lysophospholipase
MRGLTLLGGILLIGITTLCAIPEKNYSRNYQQLVNPFLGSGVRFSFRSADGITTLQGVGFRHPRDKGSIVVLNGSTESWLKYGELFFDFYRRGYSIYSYDHRGQGLSPHLDSVHPQIGQIDDISLYAADLNALVQQVILPEKPGKLYLLAHSMGATVAIDYLGRYQSPFRKVALSAPMIRINTAPYPECVAGMVVKFLHTIGQSNRYAPGKHDRDPREPFEGNKITSSKSRWHEIQRIWNQHPETVLGGPSTEWVYQALNLTSKNRRHTIARVIPVLILEAGSDSLVINPSRAEFRTIFHHFEIVDFPQSKHEILMERDPIRERAIKTILKFFNN